MENFNVPIICAGKEVKPLVCNGEFDPIHHTTRLFDGFQLYSIEDIDGM